MSDEPKKRWGAWVWWAPIVTLPVLYVLSIGPLETLARHRYIDPETVRPAYTPVIWLRDNSTVGRWLLDRYMRLWMH